MNRIHRDDVAGALYHLMSRPALNQTLLGVDEDPASQQDVYTWLCSQLNQRPPTPKTAVSTLPGARASGNKRCDSSRLRATGYKFKYPSFREGYLPLL